MHLVTLYLPRKGWRVPVVLMSSLRSSIKRIGALSLYIQIILPKATHSY